MKPNILSSQVYENDKNRRGLQYRGCPRNSYSRPCAFKSRSLVRDFFQMASAVTRVVLRCEEAKENQNLGILLILI